ncbi:leucine-rich repeat domain-containing protein [Candidatus Uabimicrobium sp. HlEnr_7]|uniref:leucine-rich repeat domain-containing protein n=1 Tax=Candidatus Uabimicrobium helgolandensis TaxID=3095367 RepID=UPI003555F58D
MSKVNENLHLAELKNNFIYKSCVFNLQKIVNDVSKCEFHECTFENEQLTFVRTNELVFEKCEFYELNLFDCKNISIKNSNVKYLNIQGATDDNEINFITNTNVQKLKLSLQLNQIPQQVFSFKNLNFLDLGGNRITNIPEEIVKMQKLEILNLRNNRLSALKTKLPKNLCFLKLFGNFIQEEDLKDLDEKYKNCKIEKTTEILDLKLPKRLVFTSKNDGAIFKDFVSRFFIKRLVSYADEVYIFTLPAIYILRDVKKYYKFRYAFNNMFESIDLDQALWIGECDIGSDIPIILDYQKNKSSPSVRALVGNKWVTWAPSFSSFLNKIGPKGWFA